MLKLGKHASLTTIATLSVAAVSMAQAQDFTLSTGSQGGSWYPIGGALKAAVEKKLDDVSITVTPGSGLANVQGVAVGRFPIAFANSISTVDGINGRAPFKKPIDNVCNLGTLYPQYFQVMALDDAGVESVTDFEGKSLTTQQNGHTGEMLTRRLLEANGLSYEDLESVSHLSYSDSVVAMKDGHAEIFTLGTALPAGSVMDLANSRDISFVPIDDETFNQFKQQNAAFQKRMVTAGSYPGVNEDVPAITYDTHMIAQCDFDDEIVTAFLEAVVENTDSLGNISRAMKDLTPKEMATDIGVPLHPAAEAFYRKHDAL
ncbi:TAXI family TRAP transporter solute-binding subunit [Modicisalibacter luteus]|uniref:TAXI family TRAP transporter solute-binding subunit n=1 Tax=Modicisalibacter luteus TaxID=453962 RepID=A0ABV7M5J7_9GAMM|nr:TAXI family TRAP transporter solute-binding subunit [Halomonas lutea]GHA87499.1 C4-dicarboxylate ABC transporter [Halomonas lutea]